MNKTQRAVLFPENADRGSLGVRTIERRSWFDDGSDINADRGLSQVTHGPA